MNNKLIFNTRASYRDHLMNEFKLTRDEAEQMIDMEEMEMQEDYEEGYKETYYIEIDKEEGIKYE